MAYYKGCKECGYYCVSYFPNIRLISKVKTTPKFSVQIAVLWDNFKPRASKTLNRNVNHYTEKPFECTGNNKDA
jgi:hypothetical protein